jgi:dipeptidyl-peptidase 4
MKQILSIIAILIYQISFGQKKDFTIKDAVLGLNSTFTTATLADLKFCGDHCLVFKKEIDSVENLVKINLPQAKYTNLFNVKNFNNALEAISAEKVKKIPNLIWKDSNQFYFNKDNNYYTATYKNNQLLIFKIYSLPTDAENIELHPNSMTAAFTQNYNLYIKGAKETEQVTTNGNENLLYGTSVHRDEFGINNGLFWSNDGSKLAYYCMDQSMVTDYPIINWTESIAVNKNIKYPFAGQKSHQVKLYVYNTKTKQSVLINTTGPADQYLTMVTWAPNNASIYVGILNRNQNSLQLNKYNALTGEFEKTIYTEKNDKYVEPQHPLFFIPTLPDEPIIMSQKDGYMHLYSINELTGKVKQITKGKWIVNEVLGYNNVVNEIIFTSTMDGALNKNVYAVDVIDKNIRRLNPSNGWHNITTSPNNKYVLDIYTNTNTPKNIDVLAIEGDYEKRLLTATNTLTDYNTAQVRNVELKASNKTSLHGKLILPHNFDSTKQYPVIVYLYNGPHVQLIKNTWPASGNLWYDYMTQQGYIIFTMDGRGSSNRGFEFESATHKQLGTIEMEDQMQGVKYLKKLKFVDTNKLGIHGWSFGGFMTTSFMLRNPGVFKVGVAGGPVMDWSKYEIMYTERYMSTPDSNKLGYENNNLLTKTKNLDGKLLLIHGTDDPVVVWQHSLAFLKECVSNGKQVDYFVYPAHEHNVRGKDRVHLMQKISTYFDDYLK